MNAAVFLPEERGKYMVHIGNDWDEILKGEFDKPYYLALRQFLIKEYRSLTVYPDMYDIFSALKATPYRQLSRLWTAAPMNLRKAFRRGTGL